MPAEALLPEVPHPLVVADLEGKVLGANAAFAATFDFRTADALVGRPFEELFPAAPGLAARVAEAGRVDTLTRLRRPDGTESDVRVSARLVPEGGGRPASVSVVALEATACRRYQHAVKAGVATAEGGEAFLDRLAESLSHALDLPIVFVGEAPGAAPSRVSVVALQVDGRRGEGFVYDLAGTPCEGVVGRSACVYPAGVADLFPVDAMLRAMGVSGYIGVPLRDSRGAPLGLLCALSRRPIADAGSAKEVLELFASRAASEIERRRAVEARTRSEEESRRIVASIPVGLHRYRLETGGALVFAGANPAADSLLGIDHTTLAGRTIEEAFPGLSSTAIPELYRGIAAGGPPWHEELVRYEHGSIRGAYLVQAFQTAPSEMVAAFLDITERLRRDEERGFLAGIAKAALTTQGLPMLLDELARALARHFRAEGALAALWDADHGRVAASAAFGSLSPAARDGALGTAVARLLGADAVRAEGPPGVAPAWQGTLDGCSSSLVAGWPLVDGSQPIGAAFVGLGADAAGLTEPPALSAEAASQLALALAKASLLSRDRERLAALLALHQTGVDLSSRLELAPLLQSIVERAQAIVGAAMAGFYRSEPDGTLELAIANGSLAGYVGVRLAPGEGAAGAAVASRRPVLVADYARYSGKAAVFGGVAIGSVLCVPVLWRDDVLGCVFVNHPETGRFGTSDLETVTLFAEQAAVAVANARLIGELQRAKDELETSYDATLEGWVRALDLRDKETEGHTQRVTEQTVALARSLGVPEDELENVRRGALLHDIGKIGVPDHILRKPGPLTEAEWALMRRHPEYARDMLAPIPYLRKALAIPYAHHERWDGTGYPRGLAAEEIPFAARVFAVVDVWDALRYDRPYRPGLPAEDVRAYLRSVAGSHLDPAVVEAFLAHDALAEPGRLAG